MKVLVTGSQGFIGRHLTARLKADGYYVTEFDIKLGQDVRKLGDLRLAMPHTDLVIHLAALNQATETFYTNPTGVLDVGVKGALNVAQVCLEEGVKDLIVLSSSEVYGEPLVVPTSESEPILIGDPANPRFSYALSKAVTEAAAFNVSHSLRKTLVIRPFNIYGPGQPRGHVIPDMLYTIGKYGVISVEGYPNATRAFCHVSDFVEGLMTAYEKGESGIYNVGVERETSIAELAGMFPAPQAAGFVVMEGSPMRRCPDTSKLRALGWSPQVTLEAGIADLLSRVRAESI